MRASSDKIRTDPRTRPSCIVVTSSNFAPAIAINGVAIITVTRHLSSMSRSQLPYCVVSAVLKSTSCDWQFISGLRLESNFHNRNYDGFHTVDLGGPMPLSHRFRERGI